MPMCLSTDPGVTHKHTNTQHTQNIRTFTLLMDARVPEHTPWRYTQIPNANANMYLYSADGRSCAWARTLTLHTNPQRKHTLGLCSWTLACLSTQSDTTHEYKHTTHAHASTLQLDAHVPEHTPWRYTQTHKYTNTQTYALILCRWTLMCLSTHPKAMQRVEKELDALGLLASSDKWVLPSRYHVISELCPNPAGIIC
jgi:hypothetical protein